MLPRHLYIHIPFCARRCSYCDFAIAVRRDVPVDAYLDGIERELATRFPERQGTVDTVYLGGGTPSRLGPSGVARLLDLVRSRWQPSDGAEITLEANPEDVDCATATAWASAGVNRVSLGAQSFDAGVLQWMHRIHDGRRVVEAAAALRAAGLANWSLDLIFALPADLARDWSADLSRAIELEPAHISCYGLTLEPHTPFARWTARGDVREAGEGAFETEFLAADTALEAAGFVHYEVSNYARAGAASRHNNAYWQRVPYVGLGPSAHGFDGTERRWNEREYSAWLARAVAGEDPVAGREVIGPEAAEIETVYLGLRTKNGVQISPADRPETDRWTQAGWAVLRGDRLQLTPLGWLRLDALTAALTEFRSHL